MTTLHTRDMPAHKPTITRWLWPVVIATALVFCAVVVGVALSIPVADTDVAEDRCMQQGPPQRGYVLGGYGSTPTGTDCEWQAPGSIIQTTVPSPWTEVAGSAAATTGLALFPWLIALCLLLGFTRIFERRRPLSASAARIVTISAIGLLVIAAAAALRAMTYL